MLGRRWEELVCRTRKNSWGRGRDGRRWRSSSRCCGCWWARDPRSPKPLAWSSSHQLSEVARSQLGNPTPKSPASPRSPTSGARISRARSPYVSLADFTDLFSASSPVNDIETSPWFRRRSRRWRFFVCVSLFSFFFFFLYIYIYPIEGFDFRSGAYRDRHSASHCPHRRRGHVHLPESVSLVFHCCWLTVGDGSSRSSNSTSSSSSFLHCFCNFYFLFLTILFFKPLL